jgi:hypothetical protein
MTRSQLVLGPTFLAVGVLALADQAGGIDAWAALSDWWPLVVLLLGVAQLLGRPRNPVGGALSLLVGTALLAFTLGVVDSLALLGPLLLVGLGVWLLLARPRISTPPGLDPTDLVAAFDDRDVRMPAGPFTGGTATTIFGDLDLDLRATTLPEGEAVLQVTTIFGDVDITVPPQWEVRVNGPEIFGSVRTPLSPTLGADPETRPPTLHLRCVTVFGDLDVRAASDVGAGTAPR